MANETPTLPVKTRYHALRRVAQGDDVAARSRAALKLVAPFVEQHEGFRDKAYWDVDGWAIGHGHKQLRDPVTGKMRPVRQTDTMDQKTSSALVRARLRANAAEMYKNLTWSRTLSPGALAALYDIAYNAGPGALSAAKSPALNKSMLVPGADRDAIVWRELPTYRKSNGKVVPGLANRRADAAVAFKPKPLSVPANLLAAAK